MFRLVGNDVSIDRSESALIVKARGLDRLAGLRKGLEVPLSAVRGATHDPGAAHDWDKSIRRPGTTILGIKWTGTFQKAGKLHYWNVTGSAKIVVVELQGHRFDRLYLTVDHPRRVVDAINAAVSG